MALETYVRKLGDDLGVAEALSRTEEGGFRLGISPTLQIALDPLDEGIELGAEVANARDEGEFYETLLLANLFGQGTGGAILSLRDEGKRVRLHRSFPFELPYITFKEQLEQFVNYAEFWEKELQGQ